MNVKYLNFTQENHLDNTFLCKYIPLERTLIALNEHKLWFANPEVWKDPYESYFLNNSFGDHDCILKNRVWASCFTTRGRSEAQWKAYSENEPSMMLELEGASFINRISQQVKDAATIYVGKVQYVSTARIKKTNCWEILGVSPSELENTSEEELSIRLMLLKRLPFQYENEIRIFIVFHNTLEGKKINGDYVNNVIDKDVLNRITICPNVIGYTRELLRDHLKQKGYKVGCHLLYDNAINQVIELV